nr:sugar phosphate isomerase/epimerase [Baekduia soli]
MSLFTGQWADRPLRSVAARAAAWGFDGLELCCWGEHYDVARALSDPPYVIARRRLLERCGLVCSAIAAHLVGQAVCDVPIDARHRAILPARVWGDGEPEGVRRRAAAEMADTARAAAAIGAQVVVGFTGSAIWHALAGFPPISDTAVDAGYADFAERWRPILDVFAAEGVRFALEVHPGEIAYDHWTTERAFAALDHPAFALNFDPSHLHWQHVDPAGFVRAHGGRIINVHAKDTALRLDGRNGLLSSHLPFGDGRRGWDFRSTGRGQIDFEEIIRALDDVGYDGPIAIEWEDAGMDRELAAQDALRFVRSLQRTPSGQRFDAAFAADDGGN